MPLVSIIIPVYNCEKFIGTCIQSAISQRYKNIEIIVVNDGSTDGSQLVIDRFKQIDNRIVLIDKPKNKGLVLARRSGSILAKGKYIQHLDGDDSLLDDAIERLVNRAEETNADIVAAPFYFCYSGKEPIRSIDLQFSELSGQEYFSLILTERAFWSVWANFRRKDLEDKYHKTLFPEISMGEDAVMMVQLILNSNKVAAVYEPILNYNKHTNSITAKIDKSKYAQIRMVDEYIKIYIEEKGLTAELAYGLAQRQLRMSFSAINSHIFQYMDYDMRILIKNLKTYPNLRSLLSLKAKIFLMCYKISPAMLRLVLKCLESRRKQKKAGERSRK